MTSPKDAWGREIKVNDICAYPVRRGSRMWVNRLHVYELVTDPDGAYKAKGVNKDGSMVVITNLDNITIIGRNNTIPMLED